MRYGLGRACIATALQILVEAAVLVGLFVVGFLFVTVACGAVECYR